MLRSYDPFVNQILLTDRPVVVEVFADLALDGRR
jgi:hypothetical protein